ncbi:hypothetical protein NUU61_010185 [Penicillium alfredii]|uniref:Uncharacterized protein n=1 Tax=Penicillium alfredii TaxID=1506179 RepID=A0A9W9EHJ3_9EURO|nr:uncharacterized protein NUU61_010185 [Penicillium alfredii]KAJ5081921.1 hypothetical protein NUU61_010185 [Penicillium alfredii]
MRQSIHCVIPPLSSPASPFPAGNGARLLARLSTRSSGYAEPLLLNQSRLLHPRSPPERVPNLARSQKATLFPTNPRLQPTTSSLTASSPFSISSVAMSSDDAYMSFLNKANADLDAGRAPQQGGGTVRTETVHASVSIPAPLQSVDAYYVSETDEPFEPVALRWEGATRGTWPSADQLSALISPDADLTQGISTLSPSSFDPKNQYASALHAVRAAAVEQAADSDPSGVDVKVYRVELTSTKLEYWVLALAAPEGRLVGLRAKAVET